MIEAAGHISDADIATVHMQRIVGDISRLEDHIKDLRIEYWGWQAMAYPVNECHHGPAHFCANCGNNMEAP